MIDYDDTQVSDEEVLEMMQREQEAKQREADEVRALKEKAKKCRFVAGMI